MFEEILSIISGMATLVLLTVAFSILDQNGLNWWSLATVALLVALIALVRSLLGRR